MRTALLYFLSQSTPLYDDKQACSAKPREALIKAVLPRVRLSSAQRAKAERALTCVSEA